MKQSFQDGCRKIVDKLTALGYPPANPKGPVEINTEIDNIYRDRYVQGYEDGVNKTAANAKIKYTYHSHTSSCYRTHTHSNGCYVDGCGGTMKNPTENANGEVWRTCNRCGFSFPCYTPSTGGDKNPPDSPCKNPNYRTLVCGQSDGTYLICGMSTSTIIKAEIDFT